MAPVPTTAPPSVEAQLRETAIRCALAAGHEQRRRRDQILQIDRAEPHDIKLAADRESEAAILSLLREVRPEDTILTEESEPRFGTGAYTWIIDPLDGTMNYYHGSRHFCSCVACYRRAGDGVAGTGLARLGTPVVGVVYAAGTDELFVGTAGGSATCNGRPIRVSPISDLAEALVGTSFGSQPVVMARMERILHSLVRRVRKVRMQGCCGLDIAGVGAGRLSALYQAGVRCWDFAAARVILEAAGGCLRAAEVAPNRWQVLAAAPGVFGEMAALVEAP